MLQQAVVRDGTDQRPPLPGVCAPFRAVAIGDISSLMDHVERGEEKENRDQQIEVSDGEHEYQHRHRQRPPRVPRITLPEPGLEQGHRVSGEQVRPANQQRDGDVDRNGATGELMNDVRDEQERR